eukprot:381694_1
MNNIDSEDTKHAEHKQSTEYFTISQYIPVSKRKDALTKQGVQLSQDLQNTTKADAASNKYVVSGVQEFGDAKRNEMGNQNEYEISDLNATQLGAWFDQFKFQKDGFKIHRVIGLGNQQNGSKMNSCSEQDYTNILILPAKYKNDELSLKIFQELVEWNE